MKTYTQAIPGTEIKFDMVPIPGGTFEMGAPSGEAKHGKDEEPQHTVQIEPFWMGAREVTWDEYEQFAFSYDLKKKKRENVDLQKQSDLEKKADAVTRPTPPYADSTFGYGRSGQPAICITHHAAMEYCRWLSEKTGMIYRLPTEAEWEYACRAGTKTAYFWGDGIDQIDEFAWFVNNAEKPMPVGKKKPSPWGLYDIHGNVAEWCLDHYDPEAYKKFAAAQALQGAGGSARRQGVSLRRSRRLVGRRRRVAAIGGSPGLEPGMERARPPAPAEHLVAHRRHVRRLPDHQAAQGARKLEGTQVPGGQR